MRLRYALCRVNGIVSGYFARVDGANIAVCYNRTHIGGFCMLREFFVSYLSNTYFKKNLSFLRFLWALK